MTGATKANSPSPPDPPAAAPGRGRNEGRPTFGRLTIAKVNAAISRRDALRGCVGKTQVTLDDAPFQVTIGGASWTVARQETRRIIQGLVLDDLQAALAEVETMLIRLRPTPTRSRL